ncbi:hypothetical protein [Metabacillus sp. FJAT-53654]|uniref:Uncharacterized protein n=1 Tax=Metabacillus rhizosphaerae TaxID=3117747 RepID=A0ABZ2MPM3_9BACI
MSLEPIRKIEDKLEELNTELSSYLRALNVADRSTDKVYTQRLIIKNMIKEVFTLPNFRSALTYKKLVGAVITFGGTYLSFKNFSNTETFIIGGLLVIMFASLLRNHVIKEMITIDGKYFHLGTYEHFKKKEFIMLKPFIHDDFKKLKDELKEDVKKLKDESKNKEDELKKQLEKITMEIKDVRSEAVIDKKGFEKETQQLKNEHSRLNIEIAKGNDNITNLITQLRATQDELEFAKQSKNTLEAFLNKLKGNLSLLVNNDLTLSHLDFGVKYALYSVKDDHIKREVVPPGVNQSELPPTIQRSEQDNIFIMAIDKPPSAFIHDEGSGIVSWSVILENQERWVLSLIMDKSQQNDWNPTNEHGKINIKVAQDLLWICCELYTKFMRKTEVGGGR